jgi:hypothetical protein
MLFSIQGRGLESPGRTINAVNFPLFALSRRVSVCARVDDGAHSKSFSSPEQPSLASLSVQVSFSRILGSIVHEASFCVSPSFACPHGGSDFPLGISEA